MTSDSRYSNHAQRALTHASLLAQHYHHPFADTSHLLVGVLRAEGSIGCQVMQAMNLSAAQAEPRLQALHPVWDGRGGEPSVSDALQTALELADRESAGLAHHYMGTEHLLLGMTWMTASSASTLLRQLGVTPEQLRSRVRRALDEGASELDLPMAKHLARPSELARRVMNAAEQTALTLDQPEVTIGHLLWVLAQETRSPTSALLRASGLDETRLRLDLADGDPRLMIPIGRILNQVLHRVEAIGSHYTGTEHLLLALLTDPAGRAALQTYGVQLDDLQPHLNLK